jgi:hypothetical protein
MSITSELETLVVLAKQHPYVATVLATLASACVLALPLLMVVGTVCSYLDDDAYPGRVGAAIRIGRQLGTVLKNTGKDWTILLFGESAAMESGSVEQGSSTKLDEKR